MDFCAAPLCDSKLSMVFSKKKYIAYGYLPKMHSEMSNQKNVVRDVYPPLYWQRTAGSHNCVAITSGSYSKLHRFLSDSFFDIENFE